MPKLDEKIARITELMRRDDSVDAPADLRKWARNIYRTRTAQERPSLMTRLVAALQVDLATGAPVFGERSAATGKARQMLFRAGEAAIDLRISGSGRTSSIRGQVIGEGFEGASVSLRSGSRETGTKADAQSRFSFAKVAKGTYSLVVKSDTLEITVEELVV